ncbi:hypothetical protein [Phycicoccus sonneratiae]|uniref:Uncharacterized protein n=1 Tax=Phycicoccus sonneratiae TaxID=2807628 RepID=A0ABS2CR75_9MICO|nr:hypothetical protein [Phycicoccus sonneraticus]MBM6402393.1 hypothetical protein [Phycicoccus sonneraticus]
MERTRQRRGARARAARDPGSVTSWVLTWAAVPALVVPAVGVLGVLEVLGEPPAGRTGAWSAEAGVLLAPFGLAVVVLLTTALLLARGRAPRAGSPVAAAAGYVVVGLLLAIAVWVPTTVLAVLWVWRRHP